MKLTVTPSEPPVGSAITVEARALTGLTNVKLVVTQPSGDVLPRTRAKGGRDGDWYTWMWTTDPAREVGVHTCRVTSDTDSGEATFEAYSTRGLPRVDYERTYVLLPPGYGAEWATAVVNAAWDAKRYTVGGSADDAGVGSLSVRNVIAVNPAAWGDDLREFYEAWYPGIHYIPVTAATPAELERKLRGEDGPTPPPPPPPASVAIGFNDPDDQGAGDWMVANSVRGPLCIPLFIGTTPRYLDYNRYADAGIPVVVNLRYSWSVDCGGGGTLPPIEEWHQFAAACIETIREGAGVWGWTIGNESNNPREWPVGHALTPSYHATIYNYILGSVDQVNISPGAVDPFYGPGSDCREWFRAVWAEVRRASFVDVHGYIRGADPSLCWSREKFGNDPLRWQHLNALGCVTTLLEVLPATRRQLPVLVSEFNHLWKTAEPDWGWVNDARASEVVCAISQAAGEWNESGGHNPISGICVYRFLGDEWGTSKNQFVLDAVRPIAPC